MREFYFVIAISIRYIYCTLFVLILETVRPSAWDRMEMMSKW